MTKEILEFLSIILKPIGLGLFIASVCWIPYHTTNGNELEYYGCTIVIALGFILYYFSSIYLDLNKK